MTTDIATRDELGALFHGAVNDHPDVMTECLSICRLYNITPQDLFYKYEAFLMSRPSGLRAKLSTPTLESMRELKKDIQREHQTKAVTASGIENTPKSTNMGMRKGKGNMNDLGGFLDGLTTPSRPTKSRPTSVPSRLSNTSNNANMQSPSFSPSNTFSTPSRETPITTSSSYRPGPSKLSVPGADLLTTPIGKGQSNSGPSSPISDPGSPSALTPQATQPFQLRTQPHSLVETLNPHLPSTRSPNNAAKPRIVLSATVDPKLWDYRYMFEKISQRSESLDDLIDDFAEIIKDAYGLSELGDPHFPSEDSVYTVGRILSTATDSSKVIANSLVLESSRLLGSGRRINLRFASSQLKYRGGAPGVKGFGLFPGCLVCVKGRNGGGGVFVVDEVLLPPPSALAQSSPSELLEYQYDRLGGEPMSLFVTAGPYTLDDDLLYHPLSALIDVVIEEKPDVVIMLGPFVDSSHPLISSGSITQFPVDIFRNQISARLQRILDNSPGTLIILVTSVRDIVNNHVAFPQAMFEKEPLGLPKRVRVLPNPCTFSINELVISLSSVDALFHLRREEFFQKAEEADADPSVVTNPADKDPMANLVRHVLGQRSFYPIFPPPDNVASEVNLDVTHSKLIKMDNAAPDLLILPSKLKHFSKIVDSTLVVNPAFLSRPHSAGTFAKILIHPMKRSELESGGMDVEGLEEEREHNLWERARSEIWRI